MAGKKKVSSLAQAARLMGQKGGRTGGPARARALSADERSAIARKGAKVRNRKKKE